ncbi:Gfo/Idh/MocA family protein [Tautonia plasticadhaerens]|uniref:1,5-anhydro-D-fructose reductase n=1 Tax=Tautonia plasticadhaerens TaxID=2527974 RepID=A0A518GXR4_9BACT|nr:Gfo/Idh/MocA family oxidoreductase [Tautonia plasticadhaerens]QDV33342.1 1,5-anhydro-D-fructose reductase [Tautonia plasticadhaerens]
MADTVRWGILGAGSMAEAFARGLAELPDAVVSAVGSRSLDRAKGLAERLRIPKAVGSVEELVASPEVDLVYVSTPNHVHREHMVLALGSGKPVLCEKPFALNAGEAREVAELARSAGLFCMEAMWSRFIPCMARLRELVRGGTIGEVQMLSAQMGYPFEYRPGGRLWDPGQGGGVLLDLGVYLVSMALDLLGPVEGVVGFASMAESGVDDRVGLVLRHSGGRLSNLSASLTGATGNDAVLSGSGGLIRVAEPFYRPERLTVRSVSPISPGADGSGGGRLALLKGMPVVRSVARRIDPLIDLARGGRRDLVVPLSGNGYQYQAAEAMRCLRAGETESPVMPLDESIAILDVLDEVRRRWGDLGSNP